MKLISHYWALQSAGIPPHEKTGWMPACRKNHVEAIKCLLEQGEITETKIGKILYLSLKSPIHQFQMV